MSLRYCAVTNLTFQMKGIDNPIIRLLHRHVCETNIGYIIVVAVRDFHLDHVLLQDFLLAITGFKGSVVMCKQRRKPNGSNHST